MPRSQFARACADVPSASACLPPSLKRRRTASIDACTGHVGTLVKLEMTVNAGERLHHSEVREQRPAGVVRAGFGGCPVDRRAIENRACQIRNEVIAHRHAPFPGEPGQRTLRRFACRIRRRTAVFRHRDPTADSVGILLRCPDSCGAGCQGWEARMRPFRRRRGQAEMTLCLFLRTSLVAARCCWTGVGRVRAHFRAQRR